MGDHTFSPPGVVAILPSRTVVAWGDMAFAEIPRFQRDARTRIDAALTRQGIVKAGPDVTFSRPPSSGQIALGAGSTIAGSFDPTDGLTVQDIPAGRAAHLRLEGSYEGLPEAWRALMVWVAAEGWELAGLRWEAYGDPSGPTTDLYMLLRG